MREKIHTKVLLVDDEPEVRQLLHIMLRSVSNVEVCGEAGNVNEALELAEMHKPDLVLLDIQMPEKDGFTFLDELRRKQLYPGIIFVTAYENYAIRAIKNAAFDYLIKPINKDELLDAISRFQDYKLRNRQADMNELVEMLQQIKPGRLRFNTRSGYFFLDPDEIIFVSADGNYSHLKMANDKTEISTVSLGQIEKMLENFSFLRVSRSYIINMKYISRVDRRTNVVELEYGEKSHTIKIPPQKIRMLEKYF